MYEALRVDTLVLEATTTSRLTVFVSIRACVSIRQHSSCLTAYVSARQHTLVLEATTTGRIAKLRCSTN
jgi:hypothetical protein